MCLHACSHARRIVTLLALACTSANLAFALLRCVLVRYGGTTKSKGPFFATTKVAPLVVLVPVLPGTAAPAAAGSSPGAGLLAVPAGGAGPVAAGTEMTNSPQGSAAKKKPTWSSPPLHAHADEATRSPPHTLIPLLDLERASVIRVGRSSGGGVSGSGSVSGSGRSALAGPDRNQLQMQQQQQRMQSSSGAGVGPPSSSSCLGEGWDASVTESVLDAAERAFQRARRDAQRDFVRAQEAANNGKKKEAGWDEARRELRGACRRAPSAAR
jgi:hypothetical protein